MQQVDFETSSRKLYHGDYLIMMTDGVLDALPAGAGGGDHEGDHYGHPRGDAQGDEQGYSGEGAWDTAITAQEMT